MRHVYYTWDGVNLNLANYRSQSRVLIQSLIELIARPSPFRYIFF